ncbi:four helix bundle protein [Aestuariivivens insulae]|uniref:four helix bundle protein n=1 Tax=Aestuariivivens insulae TaxID=1621988 RepID=UPI00293F1EF5|nr:four helix bundle protein [Aestuariivivens insulae]
MSFKTLLAYKKGFDLVIEIFHLTKDFPKSEMFGLTSQMVRSSRTTCSAIAESYRKRQYEMPVYKSCKPNRYVIIRASHLTSKNNKY